MSQERGIFEWKAKHSEKCTIGKKGNFLFPVFNRDDQLLLDIRAAKKENPCFMQLTIVSYYTVVYTVSITNKIIQASSMSDPFA